MSSLGVIISVTLMYAAPLIFAAMGGLISEKSGVINIGIEGMMTVGAFIGATVGFYSNNPWLGLFAAALGGGVFSLLHAMACITFSANQTIAGVALNLLGPGLSLFLSRRFFEGATQTFPVRSKLPKLAIGTSGIVNLESTVILAAITVASIWFYLNKTKGGLRLVSVGEHPAAADALGVNVHLMRYKAVIASGVLAGIGGAAMSLSVVSSFSSIVISGHGYIALAAVIFGRWNPIGTTLACLIFGFSQSLVVVLGFGETIQIPSQILAMLPYALTILVLIFVKGKGAGPKAAGMPYER